MVLLVPYFWNQISETSKQLGLFLSKGSDSLWALEGLETENEIMEALEGNGFPVLTLKRVNTIVYAEIDYTQLCLDDFYLSTDPDVSEKDVWQIFDIPDTVYMSEEFEAISSILTGHLN